MSICAFFFLCAEILPCATRLSVLSCSYVAEILHRVYLCFLVLMKPHATCLSVLSCFVYSEIVSCFGSEGAERTVEDDRLNVVGLNMVLEHRTGGGGPSKLFLLNLWWASLDPHTTYYYKTPHVNKNMAIWEVFDNMKKITTI